MMKASQFIDRLLRRGRPEPEHLKVGRWGEKQAARMLQRKGYTILANRLKVVRDEIDLLARRGDTLVFVEVKTRRNENFARPLAAVHYKKKHRISRAAVRYLKRLKHMPDYTRFDVVEVIGRPGEGPPVIRHVENAFPMDQRYLLRW